MRDLSINPYSYVAERLPQGCESFPKDLEQAMNALCKKSLNVETKEYNLKPFLDLYKTYPAYKQGPAYLEGHLIDENLLKYMIDQMVKNICKGEEFSKSRVSLVDIPRVELSLQINRPFEESRSVIIEALAKEMLVKKLKESPKKSVTKKINDYSFVEVKGKKIPFLRKKGERFFYQKQKSFFGVKYRGGEVYTFLKTETGALKKIT